MCCSVPVTHSLRRIETALVERVAAADPPDSFYRSAHHAVLVHRLYEVIAASGVEPALVPKDRAEEDLVQLHTADQTPAGEFDQNGP